MTTLIIGVKDSGDAKKIDDAAKEVNIVDVWDCRQEPESLKVKTTRRK